MVDESVVDPDGKVYDDIKRRRTWTKWALARDENGNEVPHNAPTAVQWCLVGSILRSHENLEPFKATVSWLVNYKNSSIDDVNDALGWHAVQSLYCHTVGELERSLNE